MYGTISRFKVKPGGWEALEASTQAQSDSTRAGALAVFRMDSDPNEVYAVAIAPSEEAYRALSESPEMHEAYLQRLQWMEAEPEWHDGQVILFRHHSAAEEAELYGTIAEMKIKPGGLDALMDREADEGQPDGAVGLWVLQMDADPNHLFMVAISESKEAYRAYSESEASTEQYEEMLKVLTGAPQWHDGRVIDYRVSIE